MKDALSQNEIDELLKTYGTAGGSSGGPAVAERQIRSYDFARPDKFSKDDLRLLRRIHTRHGSALAAKLSAKLRVIVQIELLALDQLTYKEYCSSIPEGSVFVTVDMSPLSSEAIVAFDPLFITPCNDLLAGAPPTLLAPSTTVTEIDKALMRPVLDLSLDTYVEAWQPYLSVTTEVTSMTAENTSQHVLLPSEAVLVCGYEARVGEIGSLLSVCIPASSLEVALPSSTAQMVANWSKQSRGINEQLRESVDEVALTCRAILGTTELSLGDLSSLEVGDIVALDKRADSEISLCIGEAAKFAGTLGISGRRMAVQITRCLKKAPITQVEDRQ